MAIDTYILQDSRHWRSLLTGDLVEIPLPVDTSPITHGRQIYAGNVGIKALGTDPTKLISSGSLTISTNNAVVEGMSFNDRVTINGDNVTLRNCLINVSGVNAQLLVINGSGALIENCTVRSPDGTSYYIGVSPGPGTIIRRCDIGYGVNLVTTYTSDLIIEESWLHDVRSLSDPENHEDVAEVYAGSRVNFRRNKMTMAADETAVLNVVPWFGASSVDDLRVEDNFIDGGNYHIIIAVQSTGYVRNVRVLRNDFGGHTALIVGRYAVLANHLAKPLVQTEAALTANPEAILWPTTGPDVNRWAQCEDLTPNRAGEVVLA